MKFAVVGLGRMGLSLGEGAVEQGHEVIGWDPDDGARKAGQKAGLTTVDDLAADLDLPALFEHWNHGTVIRSWLVELMGNALAHGGIGPMSDVEPDPSSLSTYVEDTDKVKWVVKWAIDHDIPVPVTGMSQQMLMAYRDLDWPAAKSVALLRNQYGGHRILRKDDEPTRS